MLTYLVFVTYFNLKLVFPVSIERLRSSTHGSYLYVVIFCVSVCISSLLAGQGQQNTTSESRSQQPAVATSPPVPLPHLNIALFKTAPLQPEISEPVDANGANVRQHVALRHTTSGTRERSISTPNVLFNHTQSRERERNSSDMHVSTLYMPVMN